MQTEHREDSDCDPGAESEEPAEELTALHYSTWALPPYQPVPVIPGQKRRANHVMLVQGHYNPQSLGCYFSMLANGLKCFQNADLLKEICM